MKLYGNFCMNFHRRPRASHAALLAPAALVLAFSSSATAQGSQEWQAFAPRNGGFSVSLPGSPKAERKVSKEGGSQTVDQDYELETDTSLFKIGYQEYDARSAKLVKVDELLDEVSKAAVGEMGGKNARPSKVSLNGFPGREVAAKIEEGGHSGTVRLRVFWAGRRLYMQLAAFADSPHASTDAARFISSLRLLKPQPK